MKKHSKPAEFGNHDAQMVESVPAQQPSPAHLRLVPAQPNTNRSYTADAADGLLVAVNPDWYMACYKGSRAQLEAERLVPSATKWPDGRAKVLWEDGDLRFTLSRVRPEGMKGPMSAWLNGDYWCLRIDVKGRDWRWREQQDLRRRVIALNDEIHQRSLLGRLEHQKMMSGYLDARSDAAFRGFMSIIVPSQKKHSRRL